MEVHNQYILYGTRICPRCFWYIQGSLHCEWKNCEFLLGGSNQRDRRTCLTITQSEISTDLKPSTSGDGTFTKKFTQAGITSALGGGIATVDVSVASIREAGKEGFVAVDSLDIGFTYAK